jgi:hypothetical protein
MITLVTPASTPLGTSTAITVVGDNFDESARVLLNNRSLLTTTAINQQTVTSFVPGDHVTEAGEYDLVVATDGGQSPPYRFEFVGGQSLGGGGCSAARGAGFGWTFLCLVALFRRRK